MDIKNGLPYIKIRPFTDQEWDDLPHLVLTEDKFWDVTVLDHNLTESDQWFDAISDLQEDPTMDLFDEFGNYRKRVVIQEAEFFDAESELFTIEDEMDHSVIYHTYKHQFQVEQGRTWKPGEGEWSVMTKEPNYEELRPFFGWLPSDIVKSTFNNSTQYARIPMSTVLKKRYKAANPALNVHRRDEPVATDTVYSDTPAIDSGATSAQLFVGTESLVLDVYGMKSDKEFVNTLEDNVHERGAMSKLISDRAQVEISNKVADFLRALCIGNWQSEPYQQHQNPAEHHYQQAKTMVNTIMDRTGSPPYLWLCCLMYVCYVLNFTYNNSIKAIPMHKLTGSTQDISPLLHFQFKEKVYYKIDDSDFPSETHEGLAWFVGIGESVGHAMTCKLLTVDTKKIIYHSNVRSAEDSDHSNLRAEPLNEKPPQIVKSKSDSIDYAADDDPGGKNKMPVFDPSDLVGRTFLMDPKEDGQRARARIVEALEDHEADLEQNPTRVKFKVSVNDDQFEEVLTYSEVLDYIQQDEENEIVWKFRKIISHEGPLTPNHPNYKGSKFNVMVEWETGEITSEPLSIIAKDDPVTCAIYARDNNLLDIEGWKRFKGLAKREKKLLRLVKQAKLRSYRTAPRFKHGFEIPKGYDHAVRLDQRNNNTKWQDAVKLEMSQMDEYGTFKDYGKGGKPPSGYKKIRVHLVFDVKHDGRHKGWLVADGNLTDLPVDSIYSGVVSLQGVHLLLFIAELNELESWATDVGNAYLEAKTKEQVYIIAGREFGELEGHTLTLVKALYGLRSSGLRWHERLADCLCDMGFTPSKAEPDIWMRKAEDHYEYVGVYIDDLVIVSKKPQEIADSLMQKHNFKLKGTGPIDVYLGCNFFHDKDGVLCMAPKMYIEKVVANYEKLFGTKPVQNVWSPLEQGDHPELDTSEFLDEMGIEIYQSLIGSIQWAVSLGCIDITTAVMTLSGF